MSIRLFITASFKKDNNKDEIEALCKLVEDAGFTAFCFIRDIEHYKTIFSNTELMLQAKEEIIKSDALLLQIDGSPTGKFIEAGIAYSLNKPIITITSTNKDIKNTILGISSVLIRYHSNGDLKLKLHRALNELKHIQKSTNHF